MNSYKTNVDNVFGGGCQTGGSSGNPDDYLSGTLSADTTTNYSNDATLCDGKDSAPSIAAAPQSKSMSTIIA
ncbi:hypothetical protein [Taibaiella soli]|nr:hypothetical protein [Taibaiella soli]